MFDVDDDTDLVHIRVLSTGGVSANAVGASTDEAQELRAALSSAINRAAKFSEDTKSG